MKHDHHNQKIGDLRPSQLLFTFGVGALVDLPNLSTLVMGLDDWDETRCREISEERLLAAVRNRLGNQVKRLALPPFVEDEFETVNPFGPQIGVPVAPYPRWLRCPSCDLLAPIESGLFKLLIDPFHPDRARYVHETCNKRVTNPVAMPVRFLTACKNGHLNDFPWIEYIHHKSSQCSSSILRFREYGVSGAAEDIVVSCESCNASRRLGDALGPDASANLPKCRGRHPHLRRFAEKECPEQQKTILLGASNSWFPLTLSVIAIPRSTDKLRRLVDEHWAVLKEADSAVTLRAFRKIGQLNAFTEYTDEDLWKTIEAKNTAETQTVDPSDVTDLKTPEWEVLSNPNPDLYSEDFTLRDVAAPAEYATQIGRVVLVERLREVRALTGFTRLESPGDFEEVGEIALERVAPLARKAPEWVPASEVRGEGIFIQFDEGAIKAWLTQPTVRKRALRFLDAHRLWRRMRGITPEDAGFPGMRYVLLHSFAHALMRQLSLECGYSASSIRERIYSAEASEVRGAIAGILIYTAASDSEGTLGGLVNLGKPERLGPHIDQALEEMRLCASDPLCAEHDPAKEGATLHGSACHACLFAPETSCERGNRYLDRATLVETFIARQLSFFPGR